MSWFPKALFDHFSSTVFQLVFFLPKRKHEMVTQLDINMFIYVLLDISNLVWYSKYSLKLEISLYKPNLGKCLQQIHNKTKT